MCSARSRAQTFETFKKTRQLLLSSGSDSRVQNNNNKNHPQILFFETETVLSCKHPENITHGIPELFKESLTKKKSTV